MTALDKKAVRRLQRLYPKRRKRDATPLDVLIENAYAMVLKTEWRFDHKNTTLHLYKEKLVPLREYQRIKNAIMRTKLGKQLRAELRARRKS